jgi:hypothetical protein
MDYESQIKILTGLVAITVLCEEAELSDYDKERGLKRGADGKWTSNKSEGSSDDIPATIGEVLSPLDIDKSIKSINSLDTKSKQGFIDSCLKNSSALDALVSTLSGLVKEGFESSRKLLDKITGNNLEENWKKFSNGVNKLISDTKDKISKVEIKPADIFIEFTLGAAILGIATWGVMNVVTAGAATLALPGVIGEALAGGNLANVGLQLLKIASNGAWGLIKLGIILPLIGQSVISTAFGKGAKDESQATEILDTEKAVKNLDTGKVTSDNILDLYDVNINKLNKYREDLKGKARNPTSDATDASASARLFKLESRLKRIERFYHSYIKTSSKEGSTRLQLERLNEEIETLKKEISEETE